MSATPPAKINRWQHAHLKERVRAHEVRLLNETRKSYPLIRETERVTQARKMVEEWDNAVEAVESAVLAEIKAAAKFTEQQFLFLSAQAGLSALELFESATVDGYKDTVTSHKTEP